ISRAPNDSARAVVYENMFLHYRYSNLDSAVSIATKARNEFLTSNYTTGVEIMNLRLGEIDIERGDLDVAERRLVECLRYFRASGRSRRIVSVLNQLGRIASQKGAADKAFTYFFEALKIAKADKNESGLTMTYTNLGIASTYNNDADAALDYYKKAIESISDTVAEVRTMSNLYLNVSAVYGRGGNYDKAKQYSELVMKRCTDPSMGDVLVAALMNLGIVYQHSGDADKAIKYLDDAMKIAAVDGTVRDEVQILINKASVAGMKDAAKAVPYLEAAREKAIGINDVTLLDDVYYTLVQVYGDLGEHKLLSKYLALQMALHDSMYTVRKAREIANLQSIFELEQSRTKLQELQVGIEQQKMKRNVLFVVACALLVISVILVLNARNRKRLFEIVKQQNEALEKANGIKDKLFSIIGHDLRGPMGNIATVVTMLQEQPDEESRNYVLELLKTQAEYTLATLDSLLLWGKSQMAGGTAASIVFSADDVVNKNMRLLQMSADSKRLSISSDILSSDKVIGDPAHFDFIVRNLLSNAIKYSREGGRVVVGGDRGSHPGYLVVSISDNGVGISKGRLDGLFRTIGVTTQGTAGEGGTGIGLMLCNEFTLINGGKIWVESEVDRGTTFFFSFPIA
ncbi:MAG: tetratricopeptide repeat-containing sensor histidine kinase, partial [Flavipsychrobacter sp.]|nr:tetratricopeptide repeat-containing sensor histidine kinase [Flavipsychrobacter sp.]